MTEPDPKASRPAPAARGDLGKTPFAHLLVYAADRKLNGSIEFADPRGGTSAVTLDAGRVVKARTSEPVAHLGQLLLDLGYVTAEALEESRGALAEAAPDQRRLHGSILVESGAITDAQLTEALSAQLALKLDHLFTLPRGATFEFFDGFDVLADFGGGDALAIDMHATIWRGLCLSPQQDHVDAALKRVEAGTLRLKAGVAVERFGFGEELARLVGGLASAPQKVAELTSTSGLSPATVRLAIYCLLITKQVEPIEAERAPSQPMGLPPAALLALSISQREWGHELLGSPAAQFDLARQNAKLAAEAAASAAAAEAAAARDAPPANVVSAEAVKRRAEIADLAAKIDRMDYFQMLGVGHEADGPQVEAAFVELAKVWHPDKLAPALRDLLDATTRVFGRLSEAHSTLADPEARRRYMMLVKEGGASPEAQAYIGRVVEAATTFQKAEIHANHGDFALADPLCRKAHELDSTQSDYLALLAWIESNHADNQSVEATRARIAMLDRAIAVSPRSQRAYYYRGMLYKKLKEGELAILDFRKAAELNPKHLDAVREVRLHEARKTASDAATKPAEAPPSSRLSGLLGKLLKKD